MTYILLYALGWLLTMLVLLRCEDNSDGVTALSPLVVFALTIAVIWPFVWLYGILLIVEKINPCRERTDHG